MSRDWINEMRCCLLLLLLLLFLLLVPFDLITFFLSLDSTSIGIWEAGSNYDAVDASWIMAHAGFLWHHSPYPPLHMICRVVAQYQFTIEFTLLTALEGLLYKEAYKSGSMYFFTESGRGLWYGWMAG